MNATRWALFRRLQATGLPVEVGTGGRTKWNRTTHQLPKTHWLDAACVGTPVKGVHPSRKESRSCGKGACSTSYHLVERRGGTTV